MKWILCSLCPPPLIAWIQTRAGVFKIVGVPGSGTQHFPESYATNDALIRRWRVGPSPQCVPVLQECMKTVTTPSNPLIAESRTSSGEWRATVRPTIEFLVKSGTPMYAFACLEVDGVDEPKLAQQWITFETSIEPNFRMIVYKGPGDGTDDRLALVTPGQVRNALERLGNAMSQSGSDDLTMGFHIVSVPLLSDWLSVGSCEQHEEQVLTCVLTAERDPREVFTLSDDLIEMTATSLLRCQTSSLCGITLRDRNNH
jgi:hypothetical protein